MKIANRVYFSTEEPVRSCVQEILENEIELLDFKNDTENSRVKINSWVESQTNGKIKDIIPNGSVRSDTRLAIVSLLSIQTGQNYNTCEFTDNEFPNLIVQVNSAYFKKETGEHQFKKSHTKVSLFYVSPKEVTQTMMMYQKGSFRHGKISFGKIL